MAFQKIPGPEIVMAKVRTGKIMFEAVEVRSIRELLSYSCGNRE
jgi:hypothetical protein